MRLLYGNDEYVAEWVRNRLPNMSAGFGPCAATGVQDGERLICGVVYNEYRPECQSSSIHFAADDPRWAMRGIITSLLHYPFEQLGCMRVGVMISHRNARSLRFVQGIGFVKEGVARRAFGKDHGVILSMLRPEYHKRFLKRLRHGNGHRNNSEIPGTAGTADTAGRVPSGADATFG